MLTVAPTFRGAACPRGSNNTIRAVSAATIFRADGDLFSATEHARGPWDPQAQHGGAPAALITAAFERMQPGGELPFARLSFGFLRPVPMAPLRLETGISRPGRRVQALHGQLLTEEGVEVCRASALRIAPVPEELPQQAAVQLTERYRSQLDPPEQGDPVGFDPAPGAANFAASAMEMRFLTEPPRTGDGTWAADQLPGAASVWMRLRHPLLADQPLTPLVRLVAAADFGNGVAAALPFDRYLFINADLEITLGRRPQGEWIGLDARTLLSPNGIGWSESILHDCAGPVGRATQALVVQPR